MIALDWLPALWVLAFLGPLVAAALKLATRGPAQVAGRGWRAVAIAGHLAALTPALAVSLGAPDGVTRIPFLMGEVTLQLDVVSRALSVVTVLLYAAALTAIARRRTERSGELAAFLLLCFIGNFGVYTAADAITFYLSFSIMSYSAVGLVISYRTDEARRATRVYLVLAVASETAVLAALVLVAGAGGLELANAPAAVAASPSRELIVWLLVAGFGTKAGLVPLHVWLPLAHPAAPPAASAVLSGAMVKAGFVGWLRFLPLGEVAMPNVELVLVMLGVIGAFGSAIVGLWQQNHKTVLAYSTIGQLGYMTVLVGVALGSPRLAAACITAGIIYAVHHGLAKGAAFIGTSVWRHHGVGRQRWLVAAGLVLASSAIVGAPLSSGAIGKYASKYAIEGVVIAGVDLVDVLPWVATGSTLLLLRMALLLRRSERERGQDLVDPELISWLGLVALSVSVPWLVADTWVPLAAVPQLDPITLWDATWPVLVGIGLWGLGWQLRGLLRRLPSVPAGDLVVVAEAAVRGVERAARRIPPLPERRPLGLVNVMRRGVGRAEAVVASWDAGLAAVVVLVVLVVVVGGVMGLGFATGGN